MSCLVCLVCKLQLFLDCFFPFNLYLMLFLLFILCHVFSCLVSFDDGMMSFISRFLTLTLTFQKLTETTAVLSFLPIKHG